MQRREKRIILKALSIAVKFDGGEDQKWNEFSGGQRSLIAICIIMTLQRCRPAPFYIFDEIDSALDHEHVNKLAKFLASESVRNGTQYLITSFK